MNVKTDLTGKLSPTQVYGEGVGTVVYLSERLSVRVSRSSCVCTSAGASQCRSTGTTVHLRAFCCVRVC